MQFAPTFTKVEEFMRGDNEINAEVYNFANFLGFASGALYAVTDLLRADMTDVKAVVDEQSPYMRSLFYQCLVFLSHLKAVYQDLKQWPDHKACLQRAAENTDRLFPYHLYSKETM